MQRHDVFGAKKDGESLMTDCSIADDVLVGAVQIAAHLGKDPKEVGYLLGTNQLPAYKLAQKWHMRKSRYLRFIEELENETLSRRAG
jgi:hypothetical protein